VDFQGTGLSETAVSLCSVTRRPLQVLRTQALRPLHAGKQGAHR